MKRMLAFVALITVISTSTTFAQQFESPRLAYGFSAGGAQGDNSGSDEWALQYRGFLQYRLISHHVLGQVGVGYTELRSDVYKADIFMIDNRFLFIPFSMTDFNPYLYAGAGVAKDINTKQSYMAMIPFGIGLQTRLTERVMLQINGGYNLVLSDELSGTKTSSSKRNTFTNGKHDGFYGFLIGVTFTSDLLP